MSIHVVAHGTVSAFIPGTQTLSVFRPDATKEEKLRRKLSGRILLLTQFGWFLDCNYIANPTDSCLDSFRTVAFKCYDVDGDGVVSHTDLFLVRVVLMPDFLSYD